jgi:hypothetical protein
MAYERDIRMVFVALRTLLSPCLIGCFNYIQALTERDFGEECGKARKMVCYEALSVEVLRI